MPEDSARILVIDDNDVILRNICRLLTSHRFVHDATTSPAEGLRLIRERAYDVVISDMRMPDMTGLELLKSVKSFSPTTDIILITGFGSINSAVRAMSEGAYHYVTKPFNQEELILIVRRALAKRELQREYDDLKQQIQRRYSFGNIIGHSDAMQKIFTLVQKVAPTTATVLLQGESGTGKELISHAIHQHSKRRRRKFVPINTASLPDSLLESELFGYKRGAFTGADTDRVGLLEDARGGTVFLDEVGSMSKAFQGKLLRVLQDNAVVPLGSSNPVLIDVRVIAASNRPLKELVASGQFRHDLFYRLSVIEITIPPLRERPDDILPLTDHFLTRFCEEHNLPRKSLTKEALRRILAHDWPGNVRELENVIRRAVIIASGRLIGAADIVTRRLVTDPWKSDGALYTLPYLKAKLSVQEEFQQRYIASILRQTKGNVAQAARRCGLSRYGLFKMMRKYDIKA